jgi:hypothetical protein
MTLREFGRGVLWFAIGAAVVAVPILLLQHKTGLPRDPVVMRTYPVAPDIQGEMKFALTEALAPSGWRVSLPADGLLLVNAPQSVQTDVEGILAQVAARKPAPTPAIHFEIWLVSATPGTGATANNETGLVEVRPALAGIQKSLGPLHFDLIEKLALQALAGNEDSQIEGAHFGMRVTPTLRHDTRGDPVIAAKFRVHAHTPNCGGPNCPGSLNALAEFPPGQLLVIGQSGLPGRPDTLSTSEPAVYYIVRASL